MFESAGLIKLVIATGGIEIFTSLLASIMMMSIIIIYSNISIIAAVGQALNVLYQLTHIRITSFFVDAWRLLHFDFAVNIVDSAANWAIFTDLLYSLYFFMPALAIVAIQRWGFGRRTFFNIVLWVADHPKGVLHAIGEMLLGLIKQIGQLKGK